MFYDKAFQLISDENLIKLNLSKRLLTIMDHYLYLGKKVYFIFFFFKKIKKIINYEL